MVHGHFIVHQKGLLDSDLPDASTDIYTLSEYRIPICNEYLHLLNYDMEPCNDNTTFDWYQCKHEYIFKVYILYWSD